MDQALHYTSMELTFYNTDDQNVLEHLETKCFQYVLK